MQVEDKKKQRLYGMLGFAMRAGKLIIGTELVCRSMPKGLPRLVVISGTASDATKKKLTVKSEFYNIPAVIVDVDTEKLGALIGKASATAAVAVTDDAFAREIRLAVTE